MSRRIVACLCDGCENNLGFYCDSDNPNYGNVRECIDYVPSCCDVDCCDSGFFECDEDCGCDDGADCRFDD